jgi:hypothetical protein
MRRLALSAVALLLATTSPGWADDYWLTGQQFAVDYCDKHPSAATSYVLGSIDGFRTATEAEGNKLFCPPEKVRAGQVMAVACKFARENPTQWNVPAPYLVVRSLSAAWPCRKTP